MHSVTSVRSALRRRILAHGRIETQATLGVFLTHEGSALFGASSATSSLPIEEATAFKCIVYASPQRFNVNGELVEPVEQFAYGNSIQDRSRGEASFALRTRGQIRDTSVGLDPKRYLATCR